MSFAASPLAVVETHFSQLAPVHLTLHGTDCHPWLCDRTYSLYELRDILLHRETPYDVRDAVWRHTIRVARHFQDWMVGALGLCMPALRAAARRACRGLTPSGVDAVESAILCETIHRARTINLAYARLAWYLTRPALRAALSVRKHELSAPVPAGTLGDRQDPAPAVAGSPDQLLAAAVYSGVLTRDQERLIARTRLENVPLAVAVAVAVAAARQEDRARTLSLLDEAEQAARRLGGDHNHRWTAFGPTNVLLHRVSTAVELGDAGQAVHQARQIGPTRFYLVEREVVLHLDTARAYAQWGKLREAHTALTTVERLAPEELKERPMVHRLVDELRSRSTGHLKRDFVHLADRAGVA